MPNVPNRFIFIKKMQLFRQNCLILPTLSSIKLFRKSKNIFRSLGNLFAFSLGVILNLFALPLVVQCRIECEWANKGGVSCTCSHFLLCCSVHCCFASKARKPQPLHHAMPSESWDFFTYLSVTNTIHFISVPFTQIWDYVASLALFVKTIKSHELSERKHRINCFRKLLNYLFYYVCICIKN